MDRARALCPAHLAVFFLQHRRVRRVLVGLRDMKSISVTRRGLERAGVRYVRDAVGMIDAQRRRASVRAGAEIVEFDGLAHWWFTQDPQRGAAAINRFWERVERE